MSFKPKQKEPYLKECFANKLRKSMGEEVSLFENRPTDTLEIFRLKYTIMRMLTSNQDLLHALHDPEYHDENDINGDSFRDKNIFSYMKLPDMKNKVKNYVCFDINQTNGRGQKEETITTTLCFRAICHQEDCETDWGIVRHDLIAGIIAEEFDWTQDLGITFVKQSDCGYTTNDGYYYRELVYTARTPNHLYSKGQRNGSA